MKHALYMGTHTRSYKMGQLARLWDQKEYMAKVSERMLPCTHQSSILLTKLKSTSNLWKWICRKEIHTHIHTHIHRHMHTHTHTHRDWPLLSLYSSLWKIPTYSKTQTSVSQCAIEALQQTRPRKHWARRCPGRASWKQTDLQATCFSSNTRNKVLLGLALKTFILKSDFDLSVRNS